MAINKKGFTIVGMLVASAIGLIVVAGLSQMFANMSSQIKQIWEFFTILIVPVLLVFGLISFTRYLVLYWLGIRVERKRQKESAYDIGNFIKEIRNKNVQSARRIGSASSSTNKVKKLSTQIAADTCYI